MKRTNVMSIGYVFACSVVGWALARSAEAQSWQPVDRIENTVANNQVTQVGWDQRTQKRSQPLQWQSVGPSDQTYTASSDRRSTNDTFDFPSIAQNTRVARRSPARLVSNEEPEVIPPGTAQLEPIVEGGFYGSEGRRVRSGCGCGRPSSEVIEDGDCDGGCDSCGDCGDCNESCDFGYELFNGCQCRWFRDLSVFVGAQGFKNGVDHGTNGNFGLHEGLNLSGPLGDPWGCGYQLGANVTQSDFSGAPTIQYGDYVLRASDRKQYFVTAGIFRRAQCRGFQWGVAFDYLHDSYYEESDLQQLRSETGYVFGNGWEIGYFGAYGVSTDRTVYGKLDVTDMFCLYLRRMFENGGEGRLWGGATGYGDGLIGVDIWVPLGNNFALGNRLNYMIPRQGRGDTAQPREAWGLTIDLIWYLGQNAKCMQQNPYRSMFNVADNSLFMVDRMANK